ncbi:deoxyribonuclease-1-like [Pseudochaenichthys georgianus]|uniref:deoxyribonuclease-1-like n=1 Tax=Pseudochaenichthys georgianus TaxID=52239 RepID=UPI00146D0945|nr:deoxyribonuclease-1-like isoform X3 [Pseudochaenichthys georgianus]
MRLLCALGLFSALLHVTSCLLIGAFNIQCFGTRKSQNKEVMDIITQIVLRYDIILIQEVRDKDGTVTQRLMDLVNQVSHQFTNISSEPLPLGPGSHKERYLFLYKHNKVTVTDSFQYDEGKAGDFNRPPFVVQFSSTQTAVTDFVLIPIHTSPSTAVEELKALVDVVKEAKRKWQNNNIMALGDFNAGSNYVPMSKRPTIPLFDTNVFHWLIGDYVDTTVSGSKQAYDRIVVTDDMYKGVSPCSAGIFDFKNQYALTLDEAKAVSDHFPVEVELS